MPNLDDGKFAVEAWATVLSGVTGAHADFEHFRSSFIGDFVLGGDGRRFDQSLIAAMSVREWQWPWFEQWRDQFERWGEWPETWPELVPDEDELADLSTAEIAIFRRASIVPLIPRTVRQVAYRNIQLSKALPGWTWRLAGMMDPLETRVASAFEARVASGDLSRLPPYFPGDRTLVQQSRRAV